MLDMHKLLVYNVDMLMGFPPKKNSWTLARTAPPVSMPMILYAIEMCLHTYTHVFFCTSLRRTFDDLLICCEYRCDSSALLQGVAYDP